MPPPPRTLDYPYTYTLILWTQGPPHSIILLGKLVVEKTLGTRTEGQREELGRGN